MEDERATPPSLPSSVLSDGSSASRPRRSNGGSSLEARLAFSSERRRASLRSSDVPPRSESQRLSAWNDHRANLLEFTDRSFETDVVQASLPVIIDFWAETCAPCRLMHAVMRRLAEAFAGRAKVGRLNVYENPRTTEALEIKAIPYLIVVRQADVILELVGDRSFEDLRGCLERLLA